MPRKEDQPASSGRPAKRPRPSASAADEIDDIFAAVPKGAPAGSAQGAKGAAGGAERRGGGCGRGGTAARGVANAGKRLAREKAFYLDTGEKLEPVRCALALGASRACRP